MLWDEGQGRKAREYLSSRNISEDWAKTFRIGFAPDDWEAILRHLKDKDFDESIIQQAGLIIKRDTGGFYDRFRNRLMFPIRDVSGRVRGFGGRTLDDSDESPKYINSPETAVFKKGQGFYGLDLAKDKIRQADRAVIVEGYFDRIRLHMAGVECALASLGTAFTAEQARMVRRYTRNVFTVFDTDSAGVKASLRALEAFLEEGITPRMVILPSSKDPDEFLEKAGGEAFLQLLDTAPTLVDFFLEKELEKGSATPAETAQAVVRMAPVLSKIREPIERGLYVKRLSERLGIPQAEIQRRLVRPVRKQGEKESETEPVGIEEDFFSIIEKELLALLINHPHVAERIESENVLDLFSNTHLATIMRTLIDQIKKTGRPDIGLIIHDIEDENLARLLTRLAMDDKEKYPDHIIDNVLEEFILKLKY
jgi:DNA primase